MSIFTASAVSELPPPELEQDPTSVSEELTDFLSQHMASFKCCAHDLAHCYRVAQLSLEIARAGMAAPCSRAYNLRVVYLAGLLHDVLDSKLVSVPDSGQHDSIERQVVNLLRVNEGTSETEATDIMVIVKSIGYKNIIKPDWNKQVVTFPVEYECIQDADLLDAIGSIGLARVFSYGGRKHRPIFGFSESASLGVVGMALTPEQYAAREGDLMHAYIHVHIHSYTCIYVHIHSYDFLLSLMLVWLLLGSGIEHFFDKLLRIRGYLRTSRGIELGEKRHLRMVEFLRSIDEELTEAKALDAGKITSLLNEYFITSPRDL